MIGDDDMIGKCAGRLFDRHQQFKQKAIFRLIEHFRIEFRNNIVDIQYDFCTKQFREQRRKYKEIRNIIDMYYLVSFFDVMFREKYRRDYQEFEQPVKKR